MFIKFKVKADKAVKIVILTAAIFLFANFLISSPALAQDANSVVWGGQQGKIGSIIGLGDEDPRIIAAKIIRVFIGFLGIIALGLVIYGGWLWMTSGGEEQKIEKAQSVLKNAAIGLAIILASFGIVTFILNKILAATSGNNSDGGNQAAPKNGLSALGSGIIASHYPSRDQKEVARNTRIAITFKEPIKVETIIDDKNGDGIFGNYSDTNGNNSPDSGEVYDTIKVDANNIPAIRIYPNGQEVGPNNIFVAVSADKKTFTFIQIPPPYIGSPSENMWYTVFLTKDIKKDNGQDAFPKVIGDIGYQWSFEVSTIIDMTPPKILEIIPVPDSTEPRNVVVQINFNEAIDPTSGSGESPAFKNIEVKNGGAMVEGIFYISNEYRTIEFLTKDACGINSCGNTVYCLPGNSILSPLVKAATLVSADQPLGIFPSDGITDMVGNSFDGNSDGKASGPQIPKAPGFGSAKPPFNANAPVPADQGDDYVWTFKTDNTINITEPKITSLSPNIGDAGVALNATVSATFDKVLMSSSLKTGDPDGGIYLLSAPAINYWRTSFNVNKKTTVQINHDLFSENISYNPQFKSNIRDIYQNCYSPCSGVNNLGNPITGNPSCCEGVQEGGVDCN